MNSNIVIGTYGFIGFHLAAWLLEQGEKTAGIDIPERSPSAADMEMSIGRNANFSFHPPDQFDKIDIAEETTVYISWYDIVKEHLGELASSTEDILQKIKDLEKLAGGLKVIVFCPLEQLEETGKGPEWENLTAKVVYLPVIYGPWQPPAMAFAAGMELDSIQAEAVLKAEYRKDAIFIEDFLRTVPEIIEMDERCVMLESRNSSQWKECALQIFSRSQIDSLPAQEYSKPGDVKRLKVKNETEPSRGISLQREHGERMKKRIGGL